MGNRGRNVLKCGKIYANIVNKAKTEFVQFSWAWKPILGKTTFIKHSLNSFK